MNTIDLSVINNFLSHEEAKGQLPDVIERAKENINRLRKAGDILALMQGLPRSQQLPFVMSNIKAFKTKFLYETALLSAYSKKSMTTNNPVFAPIIDFLFSQANQERLRAAGDPIPAKKKFILYRGVAGLGENRRVEGLSWTSSTGIAAWFALRSKEFGDPAVYQVTVPNDFIMAYTAVWHELEYLVKRPLPDKPVRLPEMPQPVKGPYNF